MFASWLLSNNIHKNRGLGHCCIQRDLLPLVNIHWYPLIHPEEETRCTGHTDPGYLPKERGCQWDLRHAMYGGSTLYRHPLNTNSLSSCLCGKLVYFLLHLSSKPRFADTFVIFQRSCPILAVCLGET